MNWSEYIGKSIIKFLLQLLVIVLGFFVSIKIWERQFTDNKKLADRKEAVELLDQTLSKCYERDIRTRRLVGFFTKRGENIGKSNSEKDEMEYAKISNDYRDMIAEWNIRRSPISSRIQLVFGRAMKAEFDAINAQFTSLNEKVIEKHLLKNSASAVVEQHSADDFKVIKKQLDRVKANIVKLDTNLNYRIQIGDLYLYD